MFKASSAPTPLNSFIAIPLSTSFIFFLLRIPKLANNIPFNNASWVVAPSINFEVTKPKVPSANALVAGLFKLPVRPNPPPNMASSTMTFALSSIGASSSIWSMALYAPNVPAPVVALAVNFPAFTVLIPCLVRKFPIFVPRLTLS